LLLRQKGCRISQERSLSRRDGPKSADRSSQQRLHLACAYCTLSTSASSIEIFRLRSLRKLRGQIALLLLRIRSFIYTYTSMKQTEKQQPIRSMNAIQSPFSKEAIALQHAHFSPLWLRIMWVLFAAVLGALCAANELFLYGNLVSWTILFRPIIYGNRIDAEAQRSISHWSFVRSLLSCANKLLAIFL